MKKNIAIIGSGISGLTCGHLLSPHHNVKVFESNHYIGGHTNTVSVNVEGKDYRVDTGFIVYNDWTYPNFIALMDKIGVSGQDTEMSFSVKHQKTGLEYNGNSLNTLFAQRRNIVRPSFYSMLSDIVKFNNLCKKMHADNAIDESLTLDQLVHKHKLGTNFTQHYLYPMCAAIWSSSLEQVTSFSAKFFINFFVNHGLLNITDRPQWQTIKGGSSEYITPLTTNFSHDIHLNTAVNNVKRDGKQYKISLDDGHEWLADDVIFACHSDQALKLLDSPSDAQTEVLGALRYAKNDVVLHTDTSVLPTRPLAWASWNYLLTGEDSETSRPAALTYNMNILQRIESDTTFCVTLNKTDNIDSSKILRRFTYAHPQFSKTSLAAQQERSRICGENNLHFCGAYWYNGFHEDGVRSALDVCQRFGIYL